MLLSVVIPTHNRSKILERAIEALLVQVKVAQDLEIIVVDDGSIDDTHGVVAAQASGSPVGLRYIYQENKGAGAARNQGIALAKGDIVLFLDDDIIASPSLLAEHLIFHREHHAINCAALGQVLLSPDIPATPINRAHAVSSWESIQPGHEVEWRYFFAGNISLKRNFLLRNEILFDESLPCLEDTDIGYRCSKAGLRIFYVAGAVGYHVHDLTLEAYVRLSAKYGRTAADLHLKYPELKNTFMDYHTFSWRNPPKRIVRDLVRPTLLNRLTAKSLMLLGLLTERHLEYIPAFIPRRLGNYHNRIGYKQRARELKLSGA